MSKFFTGIAVSEDGWVVGNHCSSNMHWLRGDMGFKTAPPGKDVPYISGITDQKLAKYAEKYPEGYELVDLLDLTVEEYMDQDELNAALDLAVKNGETPPDIVTATFADE